MLGCADVTADKTKTAYDCSGKKQTVAIHTLIIWSPCLQEDDYMSHMCPNMSHMCPNASCPVDNSYTNNLVAVLAGG